MFGRNNKKRQEKLKALSESVEKKVCDFEARHKNAMAHADVGDKLYDLYAVQAEILPFLVDTNKTTEHIINFACLKSIGCGLGSFYSGLLLGAAEIKGDFTPYLHGGELVGLGTLAMATIAINLHRKPKHKNDAVRITFNKKSVEKYLNQIDDMLTPKLERLESVQKDIALQIKNITDNPTADLFESPRFHDIGNDFTGKDSHITKLGEQYFLIQQAQNIFDAKNNNAPLNKSQSKGIQLPKKKRGI